MATSVSQMALRISQDKTEVERKRMARIVGYVAVGLVLMCFALVGISLMMSTDIDDMGRYQFNMYRKLDECVAVLLLAKSLSPDHNHRVGVVFCFSPMLDIWNEVQG
jgi:hypothetical protein